MRLEATTLFESAIFCLGMGLFACAQGSTDTEDQDRGAGRVRRLPGAKRPVPSTPTAESSSVSAKAWEYFRERYDMDDDERVTREEYPRVDAGFERLDADEDGAISLQDFQKRDYASWSLEMKEYVVAGAGPRVGDVAPDFKLASSEDEEFDLARFREKKPVVLIFGSFT
jgi:hypothetical protein